MFFYRRWGWFVSPFPYSYGLRLRVVISLGCDLPEQHHGVIFVNYVVTVQRIASQEIPEAEEEFDFRVVFQPYDVLPPGLDQRRVRRRLPVDGKRLELFEMDM